MADWGREKLPLVEGKYMYSGARYSMRELLRVIVVSLQKTKPELLIVPYRNEVGISHLKKILNEENAIQTPTSDIPDDLISWRIIKRAPVCRTSDNEPFSSNGVKDRRPRYVEAINEEKETTIRWSWEFEFLIGFHLYSKSVDSTLQLEDWFINQMLLLGPAINFLGAQRFYYLGSGRDIELNYNRSMSNMPEHLYYFRTEEAYTTHEATMRNLILSIGFDDQGAKKMDKNYNDMLDEWIKIAKSKQN